MRRRLETTDERSYRIASEQLARIEHRGHARNALPEAYVAILCLLSGATWLVLSLKTFFV